MRCQPPGRGDSTFTIDEDTAHQSTSPAAIRRDRDPLTSRHAATHPRHDLGVQRRPPATTPTRPTSTTTARTPSSTPSPTAPPPRTGHRHDQHHRSQRHPRRRRRYLHDHRRHRQSPRRCPPPTPTTTSLTYTITQRPTHGTISDSTPRRAPTPTPPRRNYSGADTIKYTVSDGNTTSTVGTVSISVSNSSTAPVIQW